MTDHKTTRQPTCQTSEVSILHTLTGHKDAYPGWSNFTYSVGVVGPNSFFPVEVFNRGPKHLDHCYPPHFARVVISPSRPGIKSEIVVPAIDKYGSCATTSAVHIACGRTYEWR